MSDTQTAVDAIRKFAKLFEPLTKVAEELERVGALENAKNERELALDKLEKEKTALQKSVKGFSDKHDALIAKAEEEVQAIHAQAAIELASAKQEAESIIEAAKKKAETIENKELALSQQALIQINAKVTAAVAEYDALNDATNKAVAAKIEAENKLIEINAKINKAKSQVSALLAE